MNEMMNEAQTECNQFHEESVAECGPCGEQMEPMSLNKLREHELKEKNLHDLAALQAIMAAEEGEALSTQQVLKRVLGFYNRYVPFMQ
jgi:hypothetical protein